MSGPLMLGKSWTPDGPRCPPSVKINGRLWAADGSHMDGKVEAKFKKKKTERKGLTASMWEGK